MKTTRLRYVCGVVLLGLGMGPGWAGQGAPDSASIAIEPIFTGRMVMGDIGDMRMQPGEEGGVRFVYTPIGNGPHEWEYKYINGAENEKPAGFAGVMYINSTIASEPGARDTDGVDLQQWPQKILWEARSIDGKANVQFVAGGITWAWGPNTGKTIERKFPDTLPSLSLGSRSIGAKWTPFEFDLAQAHLKAGSLKRVIGAFGFVISAPPSKQQPITIEIRNIRYLGKQ